MKITAKQWNRYISVLRELNNKAAEDMIKYMASHDIAKIGDTFVLSEVERKALTDYAFGIATKYGEGASAAAAEMYDAIAVASKAKVPPAVPAPTATYGEVAKTVNGTLKQSPEIVPGAVGRLVKTAGVDTTMQNAIRDGAYWAWVPQGDTCAFCIMLASRGWQRASAKALKNGHAEHIHANCDCTYVVRFGDNLFVEGYDPQQYLDMYQNADGTRWQDKLNSMRRQFYAENKATVGTGSVAEEFIPKAKTRAEAEDTLLTMFKSVSDNTKVIDDGLFVENVNRLSELNARFKILSSENVGFFTASPSGSAVAWTSTSFSNKMNRTELSLVGGRYKDAAKFHATELSYRESFFTMPCLDSEINTYTLVHEYGHIVEAYISKKRQNWDALDEKIAKAGSNLSKARTAKRNAEKAVAKDIYKEIMQIAKKNNPNFSLNDNLSRYGHTDYLEFFAEAFANSQCGKPNELGKAMQEWLKKEGF